MYKNRAEAGQMLAEKLEFLQNAGDAIVLALPRGGVPVGYEIAKSLKIPLHIFLVRKLGVPGHRELAMGAIASGGITVLNDALISELHISAADIDRVKKEEIAELERRSRLFDMAQENLLLSDKTVVLVDDGLATGASMKAAISALKQGVSNRLIVAIPVGAPDICEELRKQVFMLICPLRPAYFSSVGEWYEDFSQTTDEEVKTLLAKKTF